jgi:hypothetical protein
MLHRDVLMPRAQDAQERLRASDQRGGGQIVAQIVSPALLSSLPPGERGTSRIVVEPGAATTESTPVPKLERRPRVTASHRPCPERGRPKRGRGADNA